MNHLYRELAPVTESAWNEIHNEATRTLKMYLAGRKLVDFVGPLGWEASAVALGRSQVLGDTPQPTVQAALRQVQPLVEFKTPFTLRRGELDALASGAKDADLQPVIEAAKAAALAEDQAIFHGFPAGQIHGIGEVTTPLALSTDYLAYPRVVAEAVAHLRQLAIAGPYAIALGPRCYTGLTQTMTSAGYPVIEHVRRLLDGPVVWAPAVKGALVLSLRGGDFELTVGSDFSIGYTNHNEASVQLYLQSSFTFRVMTPEAAVALVYSE